MLAIPVKMVRPHWFTKTRTEAESNKHIKTHPDCGSHAQYLVTPEIVERLSSDSLSPW